MWKTFIASPFVGLVAALGGWFGANLIKASMTPAEFAQINYGWAGALIGATAIALLIVLYLAKGAVEPAVTTVIAGFGVALGWNHRSLPYAEGDLANGTNTGFWFILTMMALAFGLMMLGLRQARDTRERAGYHN